MATTKDYLNYICGQLAGLDVRTRPMMGEYLVYYREKLIGGLYDNALAVKDVPAARALMPDVTPQPPYEGAKGALFVERVDDREFLAELFEAMYPELPAPKPKKPRGAK